MVELFVIDHDIRSSAVHFHTPANELRVADTFAVAGQTPSLMLAEALREHCVVVGLLDTAHKGAVGGHHALGLINRDHEFCLSFSQERPIGLGHPGFSVIGIAIENDLGHELLNILWILACPVLGAAILSYETAEVSRAEVLPAPLLNGRRLLGGFWTELVFFEELLVLTLAE